MILQELINDKISKFILFLIIKFDEKLIAKRDSIIFLFLVCWHIFFLKILEILWLWQLIIFLSERQDEQIHFVEVY